MSDKMIALYNNGHYSDVTILVVYKVLSKGVSIGQVRVSVLKTKNGILQCFNIGIF